MNKRVLSFFQLFRFPNLVIVAATMLIYAFGFIYPSLNEAGVTPILWLKDLYLLVFITMSVTAFGYLHNDLVDRQTDEINEGKKMYNLASQSILYFLLLFFAFAPAPLALSLALEIEKPSYFLLYFIVIALIYFYNTQLKKLPLIGNIVIAMLCSGVIGILMLGESSALLKLKQNAPQSFNNLMFIGIAYITFAFLITLVRELVKDAEDMKGDAQTGHKTFPILFGVSSTKKLIAFIWIVFTAFIGYTSLVYFQFSGRFVWPLIFILMPAIYFPFLLFSAQERLEFGQLSLFLKYYMLAGLIFLVHLKYVI